MTTTKEHWENVFATKSENEVSWYQPYPATSVAFLKLFNLPLNASIIDIGGGDSHLVDVLIEKGYTNVHVLDISEKALNRAKQRLGAKAKMVNWIVSDITDYKPLIKFNFWHDRAAFHFLTSEESIKRYVTIAEHAINPHGYLVLGTFSTSGPEKCSGLQIKQYTKTTMSNRFEKSFTRIKCFTEEHQTPFSTMQQFLFCSFVKK